MHRTDTHSLAKLISTKRQEAHLSATELAKRAGITPSTVTRLETGDLQPRFDTVCAIADVLGIPVSDLFVSADWLPKDELPSFTPYLRSKYRAMPADARAEVEASFAEIAHRYGYDPTGPRPGEDER